MHGHSPIPYLLGEVDSEDGESAPHITGPHLYADGLAVAMDGGVTMDGKLLVTQLPLEQYAVWGRADRAPSGYGSGHHIAGTGQFWKLSRSAGTPLTSVCRRDSPIAAAAPPSPGPGVPPPAPEAHGASGMPMHSAPHLRQDRPEFERVLDEALRDADRRPRPAATGSESTRQLRAMALSAATAIAA